MSLHTQEKLREWAEEDGCSVLHDAGGLTVIAHEDNGRIQMTSNKHWSWVVTIHKPSERFGGEKYPAHVNHSSGGVDGDHMTAQALVIMFTYASAQISLLNGGT